MDKDIKRYQGIIDKLVEKSFPELKEKKIFFKKFKSKKYAGFSWNILGIRIISINKNITSRKSLVGILTHELSHLEEYEKKGVLKHILNIIKYWFVSSEFRSIEEKETDKTAIRKGYAKELFINRKWIFEFREDKSINRFYLSPEEIKNYAKKIGKW